ncbi:cysteine desulfurase family protein [Patescibacteria group bacterium]
MKKIYLDYASTTPLDQEVFEKMKPLFWEDFGNPSSVHSMGQLAGAAVESSRTKIAKFLNCSPVEIIFTSGATESNNLAIKGLVKKYHETRGKDALLPHIIASTIEHHCVLDACKSLEKEGLAEITLVPVNSDGIMEIEKVNNAIQENTILVSVMYVNNEIGTIQPIKEIGKMIRVLNENRKEKILFHTDAVQALNYVDCDVSELGADMLSFSGHKIYGPKGIGALYLKKDAKISPIIHGGGQESGLRAGTYNVPGIVGMGEAVTNIKTNQDENNQKLQELRDYLMERILTEIPESHVNGSRKKRIPNNANFRFANVEGESLLLSMDMEGICASTGSACSSGSLDPSHVILALGLKHEEAHSSLRLTIGKRTTKEDIDHAVDVIKETIERLRRISGNLLEEFNK